MTHLDPRPDRGLAVPEARPDRLHRGGLGEREQPRRRQHGHVPAPHLDGRVRLRDNDLDLGPQPRRQLHAPILPVQAPGWPKQPLARPRRPLRASLFGQATDQAASSRLIAWAATSNADIICWDAAAEDPAEWPTLAFNRGEIRYARYTCGMAEFLTRIFEAISRNAL
ncbi:hypothetical protein [Actinomadura sp. NPDC049753]|uniref:hypothetical protein n=1 Tax=Actinomadura sp. NPDC049753 TaxID=3154739 RepID=UPI00342CBD3C